MKFTLNKSSISSLSRWLTVFLLALAAFVWWLFVSDVYTAMRESSSFTRLTPYQAVVAIYLSIGACMLSAGLSLLSAVCAPAKRPLSCGLLAVSFCLVPAAWLYYQHVVGTTFNTIFAP